MKQYYLCLHYLLFYIGESLVITYLWCHNCIGLAGYGYQFEKQTIFKSSSYCRQVAIDVVILHSEKIGGVGVIVEIHESKFGKRM